MQQLLYEVEASAPGKVILFGEHAVVYGAEAIAAGLSQLRINAKAMLRQDSKVIQIRLSDLKKPIDVCWPIESFDMSFLRQTHHFLPKPSCECVEMLHRVLEAYTYEDQKALSPIVFLLLGILPTELEQRIGIVVEATQGTLPVGAGLGSSGALCSAIAAAFIACRSRTRDEKLDTDTLREINQWAFAAEVLLHGTPSGIDNTVSTYGGALSYINKAEPTLRLFADWPAVQVLVTNTCVDRESKALIQNVADRYRKWPAIIEHIFESISSISKEFRESMEEQHKSAIANDDDAKLQVLPPGVQELVLLNQKLLECLNVSHPAIQNVCAISKKHGLTTKLTGAGGGGCTLSILPPGFKQEDIQTLVRELQTEGYVCYETAVGGPGVALRNITATDR